MEKLEEREEHENQYSWSSWSRKHREGEGVKLQVLISSVIAWISLEKEQNLAKEVPSKKKIHDDFPRKEQIKISNRWEEVTVTRDWVYQLVIDHTRKNIQNEEESETKRDRQDPVQRIKAHEIASRMLRPWLKAFADWMCFTVNRKLNSD